MRAITVRKAGKIELENNRILLPLSRGLARVRVKYAGVGFADVMAVQKISQIILVGRDGPPSLGKASAGRPGRLFLVAASVSEWPLVPLTIGGPGSPALLPGSPMKMPNRRKHVRSEPILAQSTL